MAVIGNVVRKRDRGDNYMAWVRSDGVYQLAKSHHTELVPGQEVGVDHVKLGKHIRFARPDGWWKVPEKDVQYADPKTRSSRILYPCGTENSMVEVTELLRQHQDCWLVKTVDGFDNYEDTVTAIQSRGEYGAMMVADPRDINVKNTPLPDSRLAEWRTDFERDPFLLKTGHYVVAAADQGISSVMTTTYSSEFDRLALLMSRMGLRGKLFVFDISTQVSAVSKLIDIIDEKTDLRV